MVFKTVIHRHTVNPQFDQNFVFQNLTPDCLEKKSIVYVALFVFVCVCMCVRGVRISVQICVCVGDRMHNVISLTLALDKTFSAGYNYTARMKMVLPPAPNNRVM